MKIICIGRNYSGHIKELENHRPDNPVIFIKPDTSLIQKNQPFFIPAFSNNIHHEIELVVKIKRIGKYIEVTLDTDSHKDAENNVKVMCEELLVNPVIEQYTFEITHV